MRSLGWVAVFVLTGALRAEAFDPCTEKVNMPQVHDPMAEPGYCERARDGERQRLESELARQCGPGTVDIVGACAQRRRDIAALGGAYNKCIGHQRYTRDLKAKQLAMQKKLEDECRQKPSQLTLKKQAGSPRAAKPVPGAAAGPAAGASATANFNALGEMLREQQANARERYMDELRSAGRDLDKIKYGRDFKQTETIGKSTEQLDDLIDDPPPSQLPPPDKARPESDANRVMVRDNEVFGPGNACPEGTVAAHFSCRIRPPPGAARCESQTMVGSAAGPGCFGALACCITQRNAFSLLRDAQACPVRTCWGAAGKEAIDCPNASPADEAKCNINWGPPDWPSVAACPRSGGDEPAFPQPPPGPMWTAAQCSSLAQTVAEAARGVDAQHRAEKQKRLDLEAAGADIVCPHACRHGDQLQRIADSIDALRSELSNRAFGLPKGTARRGHYEQAELWARDLSSHLRFWLIQPLNSFAWDKVNDRGPYYVWSYSFDALPWREATMTSLCGELLAAEH